MRKEAFKDQNRCWLCLLLAVICLLLLAVVCLLLLAVVAAAACCWARNPLRNEPAELHQKQPNEQPHLSQSVTFDFVDRYVQNNLFEGYFPSLFQKNNVCRSPKEHPKTEVSPGDASPSVIFAHEMHLKETPSLLRLECGGPRHPRHDIVSLTWWTANTKITVKWLCRLCTPPIWLKEKWNYDKINPYLIHIIHTQKSPIVTNIEMLASSRVVIVAWLLAVRNKDLLRD